MELGIVYKTYRRQLRSFWCLLDITGSVGRLCYTMQINTLWKLPACKVIFPWDCARITNRYLYKTDGLNYLFLYGLFFRVCASPVWLTTFFYYYLFREVDVINRTKQQQKQKPKCYDLYRVVTIVHLSLPFLKLKIIRCQIGMCGLRCNTRCNFNLKWSYNQGQLYDGDQSNVILESKVFCPTLW